MARIARWREATRPLKASQTGALILAMGPAKVGKSVAVGSLYRVLPNEDVLYIHAGEGNGFRPLRDFHGIEPEVAIDVEDFLFGNRPRPIPAFWRFLEDVRRDPPRGIILDSIDGFAALVYRELAIADSKCLDSRTGVRNLNIRGYGLKLNVIRTLIRSHLMPLSAQGVHVLATCGVEPVTLRSGEDGGRNAASSTLCPSVGGKGCLEIPRLFSDVCEVKRGNGGRMVVFEEKGDSVLGSRMGFPERFPAEELGARILEAQGEVEPEPDPDPGPRGAPLEAPEDIESEPWDAAGEEPSRARPRPLRAEKAALTEVPEDYRLATDDIGVGTGEGAKHAGTDPRDNGHWQHRAIALAKKAKEEGEQLEPFDRQLAVLAYGCTKARRATEILDTVTREALALPDIMLAIGLNPATQLRALTIEELGALREAVQAAANGEEPERCCGCDRVIAPDDEVCWTPNGLLVHREEVQGERASLSVEGMLAEHLDGLHEDERMLERLRLASRSGLTARDMDPRNPSEARNLAAAIREREVFERGEVERFELEAARWRIHEELGAFEPEGRMPRLRDLFKAARYQWRKKETVTHAILDLSEERTMALADLIRQE